MNRPLRIAVMVGLTALLLAFGAAARERGEWRRQGAGEWRVFGADDAGNVDLLGFPGKRPGSHVILVDILSVRGDVEADGVTHTIRTLAVDCWRTRTAEKAFRTYAGEREVSARVTEDGRMAWGPAERSLMDRRVAQSMCMPQDWYPDHVWRGEAPAVATRWRERLRPENKQEWVVAEAGPGAVLLIDAAGAELAPDPWFWVDALEIHNNGRALYARLSLHMDCQNRVFTVTVSDVHKADGARDYTGVVDEGRLADPGIGAGAVVATVCDGKRTAEPLRHDGEGAVVADWRARLGAAPATP